MRGWLGPFAYFGHDIDTHLSGRAFVSDRLSYVCIDTSAFHTIDVPADAEKCRFSSTCS
jgi:hypothetical protein